MSRILVIDDAATVRMYHRKILGDAGWETDEAINGLEALEKVGMLNDDESFDLYVVDINMPKMDGLLLIKETRKILRFTPILALTTESQAAKRDEAKKLGASGWLVKPVTGSDLVKVVKQVLPGA